jgi:hypothetical protein
VRRPTYPQTAPPIPVTTQGLRRFLAALHQVNAPAEVISACEAALRDAEETERS